MLIYEYIVYLHENTLSSNKQIEINEIKSETKIHILI